MPASVVTTARRAGVTVRLCEDLEEVLADTDVLYVTRVQRERFDSEEEWTRVKDVYRINHSVLARAKQEMIVMHPLPRLAGMCPQSTRERAPPDFISFHCQKSIPKLILI